MKAGIVIGIGGNVGSEDEILERFRRARAALEALGPVRSAPLYRTQPVGPAQPPYLNTAVRVEAPDMQPGELISTLLELERMLGRLRPHARWGPRAIDLDVLVWGDRVVRTPELEVPHPRLVERRFALEPVVALLGPDIEIPSHGPAGVLLARLHAQPVEQIAETW
ncbi:MAG: 2-amino-4-hydroxy-6-hydroxymethyldihydropteridine diphosphokinase [Kofleriaceae bacterium]